MHIPLRPLYRGPQHALFFMCFGRHRWPRIPSSACVPGDDGVTCLLIWLPQIPRLSEIDEAANLLWSIRPGVIVNGISRHSRR